MAQTVIRLIHFFIQYQKHILLNSGNLISLILLRESQKCLASQGDETKSGVKFRDSRIIFQFSQDSKGLNRECLIYFNPLGRRFIYEIG